MYIVCSSEDPHSYAEFDCILDAEIYHEVATESQRGEVTITGVGSCKMNCAGCPRRQFEESGTVH